MTCHVNYIDSYVYYNLLSNVALKTTGNQVALNQKCKHQKTKHVNRGKREPTRKAFNVRSWIQNTNRSSSNCYFVGLFGAGQASTDPPPDWRLSTKFTEVSTKDCFFKVSWNHVLRSDLNPSALKEQNPNPVPHRSNRCKYDLFIKYWISTKPPVDHPSERTCEKVSRTFRCSPGGLGDFLNINNLLRWRK